jgi:hypothetical protein
LEFSPNEMLKSKDAFAEHGPRLKLCNILILRDNEANDSRSGLFQFSYQLMKNEDKGVRAYTLHNPDAYSFDKLEQVKVVWSQGMFQRFSFELLSYLGGHGRKATSFYAAPDVYTLG